MRVVRLKGCEKPTLTDLLMLTSLVISGCGSSASGTSVANDFIGDTDDTSQEGDNLPGNGVPDDVAPVVGGLEDSTTDDGVVDSSTGALPDDSSIPNDDSTSSNEDNQTSNGDDVQVQTAFAGGALNVRAQYFQYGV